MTGLVVNADDLGLSPAVTRGVLEAHRSGVVTSASLLVNLPAFADAVARLTDHPELGVGLHLNLTLGPPVCERTLGTPLVDRAGRFHPLKRQLARGRLAGAAALERELEAQLVRALEHGVRVTHLDTHHHLHLWLPAVARVMRRLARRHEIGWLRFFDQRPLWQSGRGPAWWLAYGLLRGAAARWSSGRRALCGAPRPSPVGLERSLRDLEIGQTASPLVELLCHPGHLDEALSDLDGYTGGRLEELRLLCAPQLRERLERQGLRLVSYRDVRAPRAAR